jgi:D-arginine dehydrogenase
MTSNTEFEYSGRFDVAIVGAGIAGASLAYELSSRCRVLLLEQESQPGYHTTGRSAALFSEIYGNQTIRALTRASRRMLESPPAGFCDSPLLSPRGVLMIGREEQMERVLSEATGASALSTDVHVVSTDFILEKVPMLRRDVIAGAVHEPAAMDVDVHGLHQGFLRAAKSRGAAIALDAGLDHLERDGDCWTLVSRDRRWRAAVVVNAAGAWADDIASMAGTNPLGLTPLRRTAVLVDPPPDMPIHDWPTVVDIDEQFYFKPDAGKLLLSPADETPSPPCDAQPDEMDVAICVDRIQSVAALDVRRINHAWAGLRTFAPDRTPVVGFDPIKPDFFWLAGQGGYGIQSAPALAQVAAALINRRELAGELSELTCVLPALAPSRFCFAGNASAVSRGK